MSLVSVRNLTKTYPGNPPLTALQNVSLEIGDAEGVAVVGPSGSGKTTLLSLIGTLDCPSSGVLWIDGVEATSLSDRDRAALRAEVLGFVFQQFYLLSALSVVENVAQGMLYKGVHRAKRQRYAMEALDRVGLADRSMCRPTVLSGGEQQRVAIARAIVGYPRLVLADEPTGSLDQANGAMVFSYLEAIAMEGTTVVVVTHDEGLAAGMSRKISLLDGAIVHEDTCDTKSRDIDFNSNKLSRWLS